MKFYNLSPLNVKVGDTVYNLKYKTNEIIHFITTIRIFTTHEVYSSMGVTGMRTIDQNWFTIKCLILGTLGQIIIKK
jgi:hypothetical protein